jgi:hypothetical protein
VLASVPVGGGGETRDESHGSTFRLRDLTAGDEGNSNIQKGNYSNIQKGITARHAHADAEAGAPPPEDQEADAADDVADAQDLILAPLRATVDQRPLPPRSRSELSVRVCVCVCVCVVCVCVCVPLWVHCVDISRAHPFQRTAREYRAPAFILERHHVSLEEHACQRTSQTSALSREACI